jgi:lipopolysaccharide transport system permease protein
MPLLQAKRAIYALMTVVCRQKMEGKTMRASQMIQAINAPWIIFSSFLRKMYVQRGLIKNFVIRDLRSRYIGSFMGLFWSVIHPIVLVVSYTFVFAVVFKVRPIALSGTDNFPLFLFCGILPWLLFSDTLVRSSTAVIDNSNLITKTLFPSEILPLTILLSGLVNHAIGFGILLIMLFWVVGKVSVFILLVPVYLFFLMLFTLGLSWLVSSLNVFVRDVSQVLSVLLTFWFWFTPIFFAPEQVKNLPWLLNLMRLNPLAHVVLGYRACILPNQIPHLNSLLVLAVSSLSVFVLGGLFFRNIKREFVDVL